MTKKQEIALEKFIGSSSGHCNCAQSVLQTFAEDYGMDKSTALKVACGFGAGLGRSQSTCGAVSGAIMVIGLKYGDNMEATYEHVRNFIRKFKASTASIECKALLDGCDLQTVEGMKAFKEGGLRQRKCSEYVALACSILEEM